jgi:uncharacterized protein (UPF0332 family)
MTVREQAIQLKLEKAKEAMTEIDFLIEKKYYNTAINRLYYSCFHATKALLLTKDLTSKTHKGVVILLHKHFVEENLFDKERANFFAKLMDERNDSDYGDFLIVSFEDVKPFILPAKEYLNYTIGLINSIQNK